MGKARVMTCNVGTPWMVLLAYLFAGILTLGGALTFAELRVGNAVRQAASYARVSFPCALVLCALISVLLFRGRPVATGAGTT